MNKIISLDMLHRTPTAGFYQTKTVSFNGGYYELYINRTQDIPNEVIVHQERSALADDYFNYYFNPTIKISVICNDNGNDVVIDQLVYESSNEPKGFKFCNLDHHLVFNGTELEIISKSCNAPQSYPINQVEIKWYISQTSLFNSVDELVRILKPYKCNVNNFSNVIKSDNCPHPYYFEEWEGIVRLINYYENRYSFTPNNNVSIIPFVNFSMHLFDDCFGQDKGGGAYVPLFLNNMNSTHFFVDFLVNYILDDIKSQLDTLIIDIPHSFLMMFDGEYLFQTFQYIQESICPLLRPKTLLINYKADDGWSLKPAMIKSKLSQLMALRVGYSKTIAQHLINHLHDHHSFEFDTTKIRTSDAFFFKKKHMPAINASQSKMQGNTVSEYHRDLVLLKWQSLVMATLMNVGLNNMSKWNQTQAEVLKLAQQYAKKTPDLEDECRQKKQLMDVEMTQGNDVGALSREIRSLKKALMIKSRAQVISSYNKQRAKISTMHWLRFCYLLLIKKRMLESLIQRLDAVPLLE